jgi:tryptophanyl-tRNA synthetase
MSKSYNNIIDIFLPEKELKKQVMSIVTDSTPMESPKNPEADNVFAIYKLLGTQDQTEALRQKYLAGNFGYGHAKQELLGLILEKFKNERAAYNLYMEGDHLERTLSRCEEKATAIASKVIERVRKKVGF